MGQPVRPTTRGGERESERRRTKRGPRQVQPNKGGGADNDGHGRTDPQQRLDHELNPKQPPPCLLLFPPPTPTNSPLLQRPVLFAAIHGLLRHGLFRRLLLLRWRFR